MSLVRMILGDPLRLGDLPAVELPVEPGRVAVHVLLHGGVQIRLLERNARHFGEGDLDHPLDVFGAYSGLSTSMCRVSSTSVSISSFL